MSRPACMIALTTTCLVFATAAHAAGPGELCVGTDPGCFATLQAALDASHDGDTVHLDAGTFAGGVVVRESVRLVGEGARRTTIRGGGPVLTIGTFDADSEPTVSVIGVTITGGVTHSSAQSTAFVGEPDVLALGGGIEVPPAAHLGNGATVTIADSIITRNRVAPAATIPSRVCPGCPFALAAGGGIDNWGVMTLRDTVVSDNEAGGPLVSDADAAGIYTEQGGLTLSNTIVKRNRAVASPPNGRFAEGGGIIVSTRAWFAGGEPTTAALTIDDSVVSDNAARLATAFGSNIETHANSGGIQIYGDDDCSQPTSGCVTATIRHSTVAGNTVTATNTAGDALGFSAGINNDGALTLRASTIRDNAVRVSVPRESDASSLADSGGIGMGGYASISESRLTGNTVTVSATAGDASAAFAGLSVGNPSLTTSIRDTIVAGNRIAAKTTTGSVTLQGTGIGHVGGGPLVVRDTSITRNVAVGRGPSGTAQGGGIWNAPYDAQLGQLSLIGSALTRNSLAVTPGILSAGGGLYTVAPPLINDTTIAGNRPDQCVGC